MPLPFIFGGISGPTEPLAALDTNFAAVGAIGVIPCSAAGTNAVALTPFANTPTISSYTDLAPSFMWSQPVTSTGAVSLNVATIGARNAYKWNGLQLCGAGDLIAGFVYKATFLTALNSGAGGFVVDTIGVNNNLSALPFIIDGGGNPITTGAKGSILPIPWLATISQWSVIGDVSGSIQIDIFRANNANPTLSIVGGGTKPNLTSQLFLGQQTPSGWTSTILNPGDVLSFSVSSASTVARVTLGLLLTKS